MVPILRISGPNSPTVPILRLTLQYKNSHEKIAKLNKTEKKFKQKNILQIPLLINHIIAVHDTFRVKHHIKGDACLKIHKI